MNTILRILANIIAIAAAIISLVTDVPIQETTHAFVVAIWIYVITLE